MLNAQTHPGDVLARDVAFDTYMQYFAAYYTEWVEGVVFKMSPVSREHDLLTQFLIRLLTLYLELTDAGSLMTAPFVMRVTPGASGREPDLHIVLKERARIVQRTMTAGAADVVIEILSEESVERDMTDKYKEYEAGGVREYWLLDPTERETFFYLLGSDGRYQRVPTPGGMFQSAVLPRFRLPIALLWQTPLPDSQQIEALVREMLREN